LIVPDDDLVRFWKRTETALEAARRSLTDPDAGELANYREFLDQNELGLALDVLVDVAAVQRAPQATWRALATIAGTMGLYPGDGVYGPTVVKINGHLAAAQEWFELRRLLNEWDPIGVYDPERDWPEDEYDCLEQPLMQRLRHGATADEIGAFLEEELTEHFGINPTGSRPHDFARRLVERLPGGRMVEEAGP